MTTPTADQTSPIKADGVLGKLKLVVTLSTIIGLLSTNIAALTSEVAHTALFDGLKQAIGFALAETIANRLLSNSPTEVRKTDVARRTAGLEAEKADLHRKINYSEVQNSSLSKEAGDLKQNYEKLEARHEKLSSDHQDLSDRHNRLTTEHGDLQGRHGRLVTEHNGLSSKHAKLIQVQSQRDAAAKKLSSRVAPRVINTATRAVSTLPEKVVPVVGTVVAVGMTLWDVKDMCETLRDINEMNAVFGYPSADEHRVCGIKVPHLSGY